MREILRQWFFVLLVYGAMWSPALFAADTRYALKEFSMDRCPACVAALEDIKELAAAGYDVQCFNTDHDPAALAECRRNYLTKRPAWLLTRASDGAVIWRGYGAGRAGVIAAIIAAKFPTPDETKGVEEPAPVEEPKEEESEETEQIEPTPVPLDAPSALAEFDANYAASSAPEVVAAPLADFRDRAPVSQKWLDAGFLDDAQDEWDSRGRSEEYEDDEDAEEEEEPAPRRKSSPKSEPKEEEEDAEEARLGDRAIDRAADRVLKGLSPYLAEFEESALKELGKIGNDATRAVSSVVAGKFEQAQGELQSRLDDAVLEIKTAILKEIQDAIRKICVLIGKVVALIAVVAVVAVFFWKKCEKATRA